MTERKNADLNEYGEFHAINKGLHGYLDMRKYVQQAIIYQNRLSCKPVEVSCTIL